MVPVTPGYKYLAALPLLEPKPLKILSEMGAPGSTLDSHDLLRPIPFPDLLNRYCHCRLLLKTATAP